LTVLKPGLVVNGRYRVDNFLAEGGMGTTWICQDLKIGDKVVAKEPKFTGNVQVDKLNWEKLEVETYVLKLLSHKGIVAFRDEFRVNSVPILVTEFVEGDIMEKILAGHPLNEKKAIDYMTQLLDAISYLQSLNVIHRDIRPKNLMMNTEAGTLKLIDFGTAKFFYHQIDLPEAIISPNGYSPPEHYKLGYSPQGDIWSAGATLFFMLTGQHPILVLGGYPESPTPPDPRKLRPQISNHLASAVIKSMQVEPSKRFVTALEMRRFLEGATQQIYLQPILAIRNHEIKITADRVIIGRNTEFDSLLSGETSEESAINLQMLEEKPLVVTEGDKMIVKVIDPGHYISRRHVELSKQNGQWYIKDLGSLNGTGVLTDSGWQAIHRGPKIESVNHPLSGNDIISLGFNTRRGPYLIMTLLAS
jgi:serine/threonine protein kinase